MILYTLNWYVLTPEVTKVCSVVLGLLQVDGIKLLVNALEIVDEDWIPCSPMGPSPALDIVAEDWTPCSLMVPSPGVVSLLMSFMF